MEYAKFGSGFSQFHDDEIYEFTDEYGVSGSVLREDFTLHRNQVVVNNRLREYLENNHLFDEESILIGDKAVVHWQDESNLNFGGIGMSVPIQNPDEDDVFELLPVVAQMYTRDFFAETGVEEKTKYEVSELLEQEFQTLVVEDEDPEFYSFDRLSVTVTHTELDVTLNWYGIPSTDENFINFYGVLNHEEIDTVAQYSSTVVSVTLADSRQVSSSIPINLVVAGGFDWSGIPGSVAQRFVTPVMDSESMFVDTVDDTEVLLIGEETVFQIPNGTVHVEVGHQSYNTYSKPETEIELSTRLSNEWGDTLCYEVDDETESVYGRIDYSSSVFIKFVIRVSQGFVGSDNYYKLMKYLDGLQPAGVSLSQSVSRLEIK